MIDSRGIYAAVLTPVDEGGAIDTARFADHARTLLARGCHGLGVFGSTSETQSFSLGERQRALEAYVEDGLDPQCMIVGVGCCARADTLALARHALALGVRRLISLPPFFHKQVSDEGLYRAFAETVDGLGDARLELFLYHFPQMSGVPITRTVIERLVERYPDVLAGVKDSSGDAANARMLAQDFPGLTVLAGADPLLLDHLRSGGAGTFSAAANINCAASRAVFDAHARGDGAAAEAGMGLVASVRGTLQAYPLIPALKHVVGAARGDAAWRRVRPPLVELDPTDGDALLGELAAAGFDLASAGRTASPA